MRWLLVALLLRTAGWAQSGMRGCFRGFGGGMDTLFVDFLSGRFTAFASRAAGGALVRQGHQDVHVVDREEARVAVQHPLVPVIVDLVGQGDDVALLEAQLAFVLRVKVVEGAAARLVHGG